MESENYCKYQIENEVQCQVKAGRIEIFGHARVFAGAVRVPSVCSRRFQIADTSQWQKLSRHITRHQHNFLSIERTLFREIMNRETLCSVDKDS